MTTEQAVSRQADHENLIQELAQALRVALNYAEVDVPLPRDAVEECRALLTKVQS